MAFPAFWEDVVISQVILYYVAKNSMFMIFLLYFLNILKNLENLIKIGSPGKIGRVGIPGIYMLTWIIHQGWHSSLILLNPLSVSTLHLTSKIVWH
jgi:hypothetical protein